MAAKPVIGIVGGVGAGKTTVAKEFERLGCERIDADAIGHELLRSEEVKRLLVDRWGEEILDAGGEVDRPTVGRKVFDDPSELEALNGIMRPRIRARIERRIERAMEDPAVPGVVLDAAILFEAGWDELCTHLVFVEAPDEIRRRRAAKGKGWDEATWREREKSQISLDTKRRKCCYALDNGSSDSHLREHVRELFRTWL